MRTVAAGCDSGRSRGLADLLGVRESVWFQLALALGLAVAGVVAVGLFLLVARLMRIHEVSQIVATLLRRGGDSAENLEVREETVIEASGDRYADLSSSGDSPTVIRPPSPSIEAAGEESTSMVQTTAAQGVEEGRGGPGRQPCLPGPCSPRVTASRS